MQILKSGLKSNKIVTLLGLLLALIYLTPDFLDTTKDLRSVSYDVGKAILKKAVPLPSQKPADLGPNGSEVSALEAKFEKAGYNLKDIRAGKAVPRLFINRMPADLPDMKDVSLRKRTFIKVVLPLVLRINDKIAARRDRLKTLVKEVRGGTVLPAEDRHWLEDVAAYYREKPDNLEALLVKVDRVPVSMALAQAIEESGWGTSRFAQEGNALFGQRVWNSGKGIVPEDRTDGETHEVKAFKTLAQSVKEYIHNLNVHQAYTDFRKRRAEERQTGSASLNGLDLIHTLTTYSERGTGYVDNLQSLIEVNRLDQFDGATLTPERFAANRP